MRSAIAAAVSLFDISGRAFPPSASMIVTLLVSTPNPAPLSRSELRTMKSKFLRRSFSSAFTISSSVSSANPTSRRSPFSRPRLAAISFVRRSSIVSVSPSFFILERLTSFGV